MGKYIPTHFCRFFWFACVVTMSGVQPAIARGQAGTFGESFPVGWLAGMGNCDAMAAGEATGLLFNPSHAAWDLGWSAAGGYRRLYELEYFQRVWGAAKYHRKRWGIGVSVTRFGKEDFYTETKAAAACGLRLKRNIAIGVELSMMRLAYTTAMPDYSGWSLGLGAIYQPVSAITIAGAIGQVAGGDFIPGYALPRHYRMSVAAKAPGDVVLGIGWSKREGDRDLIGLGQRLPLAHNFRILSAVYFDLARYALGGELRLFKQTICYCYLSHPDLGGTHYFEFKISP